MNPEKLGGVARKFRSFSGYIGDRRARGSSLANYPIIWFRDGIRDACASLCLSLLSSLPSSLFSGRALWSDQTSFRFRLSVSTRFVSCTCIAFLGRRRKNRKHRRGSRRWLSYVESMRNFPASRRDLLPYFEPFANSVNRLLYSKTNWDGECRVSLTVEQVSCFELLSIYLYKYICRKSL